MATVRRAADRFVSGMPGIRTWHSFSAGGHYDPDNVAFGPIVGLDEHVLEPAAGFDWHRHRGVHIVSWVLAGSLRHEDSDGAVRVVAPGALLVQSAGDGIRHTETNAAQQPLRFLQLTVLGEAVAGVRVVAPPVVVGGVRIEVRHGDFSSDGSQTLVHVVRGVYAEDGRRLAAGDSVRVDPGEVVVLAGDGELLVVHPAAD